MANPVDVSSIDVLRSVREAILLFTDDARSALGNMDMEVRRCLNWLAHDQTLHWKAEIKRRGDKLGEAKAELHRKQLSPMSGGHAKDSEQKEKVREAKHRLEEAEDKLELVGRWLPIVEQAQMDYNGQAGPFGDMLEFEVERSVELLDRMISALEDYVRDAPPMSTTPRSSAATPAPSIASATVAVAPTSAEADGAPSEAVGAPEQEDA